MSSRKAILAAAAALLALAGIGAGALLATSGDDSSAPLPGVSVATAPERQPPDTTAVVPTDSEPPAATTQPDAVPDQAQPAPQPSTPRDARKTSFPRERGKVRDDPPQRNFAIPPAREFSGTGNATLGNVDLRRSAVVRWRTKGRFELRFGREDFPIVAPSASGQLIVPPYDFERVRVIAQGRWKISITPQK